MNASNASNAIAAVSNLFELTSDSTPALHPDNINISLRPHQLTLLHHCKTLESGDVAIDASRMPSNISSPPFTTHVSCTMKTRVGIIADKVGSGKSNVILSLIATDPDIDEMTSQFTSTYTYGLNNITLTVQQQKKMCNVNVLVIPHNLVSQWATYINGFFKNPVKSIVISKSKHFDTLTLQSLREYRLIAVTCTFYPRLVQLLRRSDIQVKRAMYDEIDSMSISATDIIDASFYWFVTASYLNLIHPRGHGRYDRITNRYMVVAEGMRAGGFIKALFSNLQASSTPATRHITNLIVAKNHDAFVDASILLPPIDFHYIRCKTPRAINILEGIVDRHIIQCLNSGDIEGAIHFVNPTQCSTQDNIINILLERFTKSLHNVNTMIDYVTNHMQYDTEQQRTHELERLNKKRDDFLNKVNSITARIKDTDTCCICYDNITNKTIVNCCMNSYCFQCISTWVSQRHSCPLCKERMDIDKFFVVREGANAAAALAAASLARDVEIIDEDKPHESFDKMKNLKNVIKQISEQNPNNKVLIFSMNEGIFDKIQDMLSDMNRNFKMLKGTYMSINNTVEKYKNGDLNTLLVNPENYGSGLNLENTTDMIMLHKFDSEIEKQVIGRAQRYGRSTSLRVWYLLYENEFGTAPTADPITVSNTSDTASTSTAAV